MFAANAMQHAAIRFICVLPSLRASHASTLPRITSTTRAYSAVNPQHRRLPCRTSVAAAAAANDSSAESSEPNPIFTGPQPAIILAGFYLEELPAVRLLLDAAGGHDITLVPCMPPLLDQPLQRALEQGEPQWNAPMPSDWVQGGGWGRQRVVLLNDLAPMATNTIIAMLEASPAGAEGLCSMVVGAEDLGRRLGEVLGTAAMAEQGEDLGVDGSEEDFLRFIEGEEALPPVEAAMGGSAKDVYAAAAAVGEIGNAAEETEDDEDFDDLIDQIAKDLS